jgi:hypothetical protein
MIALDWLTDFDRPPASCRHVMFWIWNGQVTERRITEMLEQFAQRGIGGVLVHPRGGLVTEYLSERWWQLWQHSLDECLRLGLECHIYDENGFPSGAAGGLTLEANPGVAPTLIAPELHSAQPVTLDGRLVAAFRCETDGHAPERLPEGADLDAVVADGPLVAFVERPGHRSYPDLSLPEATGTFLRVTHDEYARRFADHFGSVVKYVFTDEPGLQCHHGLVVSPYLLAQFEQEHGYSLLDRLGAFASGGDEGRAVRFDYLSTVNRLWIDAFCRHIHQWCEEHGVAFTGHYNEHEWPDPGSVPDAMAAQRWMQVPGIDLLGFQFEPGDRLSNSPYLLTIKEVASVANQVGAGRVFCEAYGGGGYEMALREFKPLSDWLLANGVNVIDPHLSHQTIAGARKYDWPQTISDHAAWWPFYRAQADHDARLTVAVTQGRERNRVLLLHPTLTAWMYHPSIPLRHDRRDGLSPPLAHLQQQQCRTAQALADHQVDFDLGDELVMREMGSVDARLLRVGCAAYSVVVLPDCMELWLDSTLRLVEKFLAAGGSLLALGDPPAFLNARRSDAPSCLAEHFPTGWRRCDSMDGLLRELRALCPPRVSGPDGLPLPPEITYYRRELPDGKAVHLFVNPWQRPAATPVRLEGRSLLRLDTMTGRSEMVPTAAHADGQVLGLALPPSGHALFVSGPEQGRLAPREVGTTSPVELGEVHVSRAEANVLLLDYCDLEARGPAGARSAHGVNTTHANRLAWQAMRFGRDPWHGRQFRRTLVDHVFPDDTELVVTYRFVLAPEAAAAVSPSLELAVERPWLYHVSVNGTRVEFPDDARWWDEEIRKAPIGAYARPGENTIRMAACPFQILCEVAPVYVLGDFDAVVSSPGFSLAAPRPLALGDWREQGLAFYPWTVRYTAPFDLTRPADGLTVRLPQWSGSAARVTVDGECAGAILYPPFALDVEHPFRAGRHDLAVDVTGNMRNILGPHFCDGLPGIWSWEIHPEHAPDGDAYKLWPAGLTAPPVVTARQHP